ncbi:MAG: DUF4417 domain-containing protein [Selenomonadaceae bacterium]|nr:DUF4417 domain-containing protein [Selenomonadaceae bacterium]
MKQKNSEEKIFDLVRPLYQHKLNQFGIPIMNKITEDQLDFAKIKPLNVQNLSVRKNNSNKFVLGFSDDNRIERFYNNPFKYVPRFQSAYAVATPDYSLHPQMNPLTYLHQIYKNRWLGCFWQEHGIMALPCVGWTTEEWDDLSFVAIEIGSVVVISTLGCKRDVDFFMRGYNEMIRRIEPPLIIVYGDMLPEMRGRFVNFRYEDSFQPKIPCCVQGVLFEVSPIFERR